MRTLDAWYAHLDEEAIQEGITQAVRSKRLGNKEAREARQDIAKARTRDSVRVLARRAGKVAGELRIVRDPPLITPIEDLLLSAEARERAEQQVHRLMQAASDIFLGWLRVADLDGQVRDYYMRQFHDWKGSPEVETMRVPGTTLYARMCGATLARAHARDRRLPRSC